jgi:hypothetical protein
MFDVPATPYSWFVSVFNLANLGWTAFIYTCYRVIKLSFSLGASFTSFFDRLARGEEVLLTLSTNHLPHIQAELEKSTAQQEKILDTLEGLREDVRYGNKRAMESYVSAHADAVRESSI